MGRFTKKCISKGYIPDLDCTTVHKDSDQPIRAVKQEEDPTKTTTTPAAPPEVEGPPSSHLKSKTKQQTTSTQPDLPECNPSTMDPLECNPAQIEANEVQIVPGIDIFVQPTHTLLWAKRVSKHKAPVVAPHLSHTPLDHCRTTCKDIFPGSLQLQKLNQFSIGKIF